MANSDQIRSNRRTAQFLFVSGFVPLAFMTLWLVASADEHSLHGAMIFGLKAYAAMALSFLGGGRWILTFLEDGTRTRRELLLCSMPLLAGWVSLVVPDAFGFAVLAVAFAALGALDQLCSLHSSIPTSLGRMRFYLTILAVVSMIIAFAETADSITLP